jgi:NADH-quinone oxidoreductase subunit G
MPKITIDGKELEVPAGINLIEAAKLAGVAVPHYCYHPKLSIAGNCRICLVEIEKQPKLQIACNTKVAEGMVVRTSGPKVEEGRQSVLEFILVNHPIDCPVCDQAGECKLQDYYMKLDGKPSRMEEVKVQKEKAIRLGPNVMLDMERCILCSRCIRFCQEVAHDDELCFVERGAHTELTSYPGKELDNPYSVNTVDICPVGALTSADFRFKQRVWFLKTADTVCPGCATGCNIKLWHNNGVAYRLTPRENEAVNQVWMCDEGRFTYKPVNEKNRLRHPIVKREGKNQALRKELAIAELKKALDGVPGNAILGIGSAEFTNEANYSFLRFLRDVLGVKDFVYHAKEVANASHDDFLISADKNPNRAGVEALGFKPLAEDRRYQVFFALGHLPFPKIQKIAFEKNRKVVLWATHDVPEIAYADFVFPTATWAEDEGTFTNKQKRVQRIYPAFPPPGEAVTVWEWMVRIAKAMGSDKIRYEHFSHVQADLAENVPTFKGVNDEKIGKGGIQLAQTA